MKLFLIEELLEYPDAKIIDIRDYNRFMEGHIPRAINIPMQELTRDPEKYLSKNYIYYIYCEFGYKSKRICKVLNELGYQTIDVKDGYFAYEMLKK